MGGPLEQMPTSYRLIGYRRAPPFKGCCTYSMEAENISKAAILVPVVQRTANIAPAG